MKLADNFRKVVTLYIFIDLHIYFGILLFSSFLLMTSSAMSMAATARAATSSVARTKDPTEATPESSKRQAKVELTSTGK